MSCSVQIKTRNTVKSKKVNNVIHRTTSETIRLGDADLLSNSSRQLTRVLSPPPLKQSSCSFQVTAVSVTQRPDCGDDSADDLDESHTDDISRVTDNETPSYSEDTCSRDAEDYIGLCSALCSVTVIPPSSQYGLAMMPLSTSPISTRFKVVKVETSTPFRRGRWWCMDYLDESPYAPKNAFTYKSSGGLEICSELQYTMTATTLQSQNSVEFGTNLSSTDITKSTSPKMICSVSELHSSYFPHSQKEKFPDHASIPHSNLKTKNGAVTVSNAYCKPCEKILSNATKQDFLKSENLKFNLDSLMGLSLVDIIHNSLHQDFKTSPRFNECEAGKSDSLNENKPCNSAPPCHKTETVSSYLAWELFTQTPLKTSSTHNGCILKKAPLHTIEVERNDIHTEALSEVSTVKFSIKRQNPAPPQSVTTSINKDSVPITTQANTSSTHKVFLASSTDGSAENSVGVIDDSSVLSTFPIMSSPFSIFDDIGILATRAIFDNLANSTASSTPTVIDQRIELALDLVKGYLLYAVNQEVDTLKQQITVLLDRIGQLERENSFLRANVSPHVLNILYGLPSLYPSRYNSKPGNGTAPPPPPSK
ncbi:hypothetical protein PPYR_05715 [Photinus pyralis]|uniref:Uncharacterized protein n=1 Tax=Photinus pyralis TaxID=7054 RepID=A0A5N4AVJ4_PHOPY|nr:hypothetical protein PPYR_05715 [Photinus pyralis]